MLKSNLIKAYSIGLLMLTCAHSCEETFTRLLNSINEKSSNLDLTPVHQGASNLNYCLKDQDFKYFIKCSPQKGEHLFADLQIEVDVLKKLQSLNISPIPIHFDEQNRILVLNFIESDSDLINLQDPKIQASVFSLLHQIEKSEIDINRKFLPCSTFIYLLEQAKKFESCTDYDDFFYEAIPMLKEIERFIDSTGKKSLCHLDLHRKNLIKSSDKIFIIDWEYAAMAHPLLTLASMASIERWDDKEMESALNRYYEEPTAEEYKILHFYRFSMDVFWALWNNIQAGLRPTDQPYETWRDLFLDASKSRYEYLKLKKYLDIN